MTFETVGFYKSKVKFGFALGFSIMAHVIFFVYIVSLLPPRHSDAPGRNLKPNYISVNFLAPIDDETLANEKKIRVLNNEVSLNSNQETAEEKSAEYLSGSSKTEISSSANMASFIDTKFHTIGELDQIPITRKTVHVESLELPSYLDFGELSLRLYVDERGKVIRVESINSDLPVDLLERAKDLFLQADFFPGTLNNQPVKFVSKVVVKFAPENAMHNSN